MQNDLLSNLAENSTPVMYRKQINSIYGWFQRVQCPTFDIILDAGDTNIYKIVNGVWSNISASISPGTVWRCGIWDGSKVVIYASEKIAWSSDGVTWTVGGTLPFPTYTNKTFMTMKYFDGAFWGYFRFTNESSTVYWMMRNTTDLTSGAGWEFSSLQQDTGWPCFAGDFIFCKNISSSVSNGYKYDASNNTWALVPNNSAYYDAIRWSSQDSIYYSYRYNATTNAIDVYGTYDGIVFLLVTSVPVNHRFSMTNEASTIRLTSEFLILYLSAGDSSQSNIYKFGRNGTLVEVLVPGSIDSYGLGYISESFTDSYGKYYYMTGSFGGTNARIMQ